MDVVTVFLKVQTIRNHKVIAYQQLTTMRVLLERLYHLTALLVRYSYISACVDAEQLQKPSP